MADIDEANMGLKWFHARKVRAGMFGSTTLQFRGYPHLDQAIRSV